MERLKGIEINKIINKRSPLISLFFYYDNEEEQNMIKNACNIHEFVIIQHFKENNVYQIACPSNLCCGGNSYYTEMNYAFRFLDNLIVSNFICLIDDTKKIYSFTEFLNWMIKNEKNYITNKLNHEGIFPVTIDSITTLQKIKNMF